MVMIRCCTTKLLFLQGMHFNESFCGCPKVLIRQVKKHGELPEPSEQLFPVEVRTREEGLPDFDHRTYFRFIIFEHIQQQCGFGDHQSPNTLAFFNVLRWQAFNL